MQNTKNITMVIDTYTTLIDKSTHFDSVTIDTPADFESFIKKWARLKNNRRYIFRGLTEAKYKLYNSAQRVWRVQELEHLGRTYEQFIQIQIGEAKLFQNSLLIKFYNAFGHTAYDLSVLSFLQHYGAPTPLLDFTYNVNCALFFGIDGLQHTASTDINNYFSIYAIDTGQLAFGSIIRHIASHLKDIDTATRNSEEPFDVTLLLDAIARLSYEYIHSLKLFYIPGYTPGGTHFEIPGFNLVYNQHNLNIINQEGLFVYNSDADRPLEEFFIGKKNADGIFTSPKIKCWNIHKSLNTHINRYLETLPIPINKEFMYPQEEFIAQSAFRHFKTLGR
ncbi:FRG domain-containing protein [Fulvivirgaceae bacterium PWU5]|uniref:FRG domain-containing protein n=1 Tax=Dawidia cretensis TaxID=2782350 RepID=A0AAP2E4W6_9BACT|nr:FRG domain-containing protein [Dawidia cretensis]MBT1712353.1 FRG domain-containing protein [Dawidia cretensis]